MAILYILVSEQNQRFYIGSTNDLDRRIKEHNRGNTKSTRFLGPWKIVLSQYYPTIAVAKKVEKRLKNFKNRHIIEKIVRDGIIKIVV